MSETDRHRLSESLRGFLANGVDTVRTRLALFAVEIREEKLRAAGFLFNTVFAAIFIGAGLVFLAVLLTVLWWDSNRLLALGIGTAVLLAAGLFCATRAARESARGSALFSASLAELERDSESIRREP